MKVLCLLFFCSLFLYCEGSIYVTPVIISPQPGDTVGRIVNFTVYLPLPSNETVSAFVVGLYETDVGSFFDYDTGVYNNAIGHSVPLHNGSYHTFICNTSVADYHNFLVNDTYSSAVIQQNTAGAIPVPGNYSFFFLYELPGSYSFSYAEVPVTIDYALCRLHLIFSPPSDPWAMNLPYTLQFQIKETGNCSCANQTMYLFEEGSFFINSTSFTCNATNSLVFPPYTFNETGNYSLALISDASIDYDAIEEYFNVTIEDPVPVNCSNGTFHTDTYSSLCIICPAGDFCPFNTTIPLPCSPGHYCVAGSSSPTPCNIGYFSNATHLALCLPCPVGTFGNSSGSTKCISCAIGKYSSNTATSSCIGCMPGTYSNVTSLSACINCGVGTYSNTSGQSQCAICGAGEFTPYNGATSCLLITTTTTTTTTTHAPTTTTTTVAPLNATASSSTSLSTDGVIGISIGSACAAVLIYYILYKTCKWRAQRAYHPLENP